MGLFLKKTKYEKMMSDNLRDTKIEDNFDFLSDNSDLIYLMPQKYIKKIKCGDYLWNST
jgi:hypothetical protein